MSPNKDQEYFSDGLTEELLNSLAQVPGLRVAARTSSFSFKGKNAKIGEIGKDLNVSSILEGSVRKEGKKVRITAQLINVADGFHVWSNTYDKEMNDIFAVQEEIAQNVAEALKVTLLGHNISVRSTNPDAYQRYLQGRFYWNKRDEASLMKSIEYYNQAIQLDPNYAIAYAGLAETYAVAPGWGVGSTKELSPKAIEFASKALELDHTLAQAHAALGVAVFSSQFDRSAAEKNFLKALELNPNYATAHHWYGDFLSVIDREEDFLSEEKKALELDLLSLQINVTYAFSLIMNGRYDEALKQLQKTKEMDPEYCGAYIHSAQAYRMMGKLEEAIEELGKPEVQNCSGFWELSELGYTYALAGNRMEAQKMIDKLTEQSKQRYVPPQFLAVIYLGLGNNRQALSLLEKGYQEGTLWIYDLVVYLPILHSNPIFAELLRRIHL